MSTKLTRKALYELVWSQPRTHIAKAMGVSDVWIGKQCRDLNVPAPPAGYWASRASGKKLKTKYQKPPLTYTVAERIQEDHDGIVEALAIIERQNGSETLPASPEFVESIESAVTRYTDLARKEVGRRRTHTHHPVVQKLLDEDGRRAAAKSPLSWQQPIYRTIVGEATLAAIEAIASHWEACGFALTASGRRDIRVAVSAPSYTRSIEVRPVATSSSTVKPGRPSQQVRLGLWLDRDHHDHRVESKPSLEFGKVDAGVIEAATALLITKSEESFRARMVWRRERIVAERLQALRAAEAAERKVREDQEAAVFALRSRRELLLREALDGARRAKEIRHLVAGLNASPSADSSKEQLERWSAWALQQAEELDPVLQDRDTLKAWLRKFELDA